MTPSSIASDTAPTSVATGITPSRCASKMVSGSPSPREGISSTSIRANASASSSRENAAGWRDIQSGTSSPSAPSTAPPVIENSTGSPRQRRAISRNLSAPFCASNRPRNPTRSGPSPARSARADSAA